MLPNVSLDSERIFDMETLKEWLLDIAIFLLVSIITAGLEARPVEVNCGEARAPAVQVAP